MAHLDGWHANWKDTNTPAFHRAKLAPVITQLQSKFLPSDKSCAIFIPLCGKAIEIKVFHDMGYKIIGIEASEKGIGHLSDENNLELQPTPIEGFGKVYANADQSIQIYNGDLFKFSRKLLKEDIKIGAIVDKGSLVALPPDLRVKYSHVMAEFAEDSNCKYLMCLYEHNMQMKPGPPHVVPLEYVCVQLGKWGYRMTDYYRGEQFDNLGPNEIELIQKSGATEFSESAFLFERS